MKVGFGVLWLLACGPLVLAVDPATLAAPVELWDSRIPQPATAELQPLKGLRFSVIKRRQPEVDGYNWLHGIALVWYRDQLFASFGHNRGSENTASEEASFRVSSDAGRTWTDVLRIDDEQEPDLAVSHGVFLNDGTNLWAFQGAFRGRMQDVHTRAYRYDADSGQWVGLGPVAADGFWPMQEPQRLGNGNWVMAGLVVDGGIGQMNDPAAVAISAGNDLTRWQVVQIPRPPAIAMWGESTVILSGSQLINISRYHRPLALVSESRDYGLTWTPIAVSSLHMAASKPYAGTLSSGQHYLIGSMTADGGNRRSPLTIAVTRPGVTVFSKVFRIRGAEHEGPGESDPRAALAYPYAVERDGQLYVGYSNSGGRPGNQNSGELAVIPVSLLAAD